MATRGPHQEEAPLVGAEGGDDVHISGLDGQVGRGELQLLDAHEHGLNAWDVRASYAVYALYQERGCGRWPLIGLELSGHGALWLVGAVVWFFLPFTSGGACTLLLNLLVGLLLDLAATIVCKPLFRRTRPRWADQRQLGTVEVVDQYSFPSGHASRAVFVACFLLYAAALGSVPVVVAVLAGVWAALVAVSRVALGRHHVLDVLAGTAVGVLNVWLVSALWVGQDQTLALRGAITGLFH
eukprot:comp19420_c0_seq1/m.22510 comp19420_c0_seq1/g.22510  ORF comp19420_c0_seq1/g.22510 comp19420_c0_seq1/m.22510 type:complete len:240 (-) comp19420_c0_seq1:183-902(-)